MNTHGIGLGLVISQNIVSQFEGKITVTSEVGLGSNFTFSFKLDDDEMQRSIDEQYQEYKLNSHDFVFKWNPDDSNEEVKYVSDLQVHQYHEADDVSLIH